MAKKEADAASRRAKVTPETQEEAKKLRALWDTRAHENQTLFGEKYEIGNQSAVGQFLRGETPLSLKAARGFAKGLGCEMAEFSPRLAAEASIYAELSPAQAHRAQERAADSTASFSPPYPLTVADAIDRIAEVLAGLDEDGREMASTALSNLAKNPSKADKTAQMLNAVIALHPRAPSLEPEPQPPAGPRKRKAPAAERRAPERQRLTVTVGGGQKMQQDLPLKRALHPANDPFDERNAPANERQWYERVKAAPKAKARARAKP